MTFDVVYNTIAYTLLAVSAINVGATLKRDLMMLQQNSYRNERYVKWLNKSGESSRMGRLVILVALFLILVHHLPFVVTGVLAILIVAANLVTLLKAKYKKPLTFTARAKRIYITSLLITAVFTAIAGYTSKSIYVADVALLAIIFVSPCIMLLSNLVLVPLEKRINRRYYDDAARILAAMPDLKVIGITGSYGKTSTKHYIYRILTEHFDVVMTPGSYNTTLGVVRTIREYLKPYNEVFIVEMGAKQPGDIKEICDLVHPRAGIVTAVGEQHLETFKSVENVQRTKFELIDSLPADGFAVINSDFPMAASRVIDNVRSNHYSLHADIEAEYHATDIKVGRHGTSFTIIGPDGYKLDLTTRLVGDCNISNVVGAVVMARYLGVPDEKIVRAVAHIEQVEHRLNMKRTAGGITIIDDAFNSNPTGSAMALDVLRTVDVPGRRIVITPGMIELGDRQEELNRQFGAKIPAAADVAIIVGEYNRNAILDGIADGMPEDSVITVATFNEAQRVLTSMVKAGDAVLYENDLPDTFK